MINVSNDFKTRTKKIKQQSIKLGIVDGELTVKEVHFMTVKQFNALPVWMLRKRQEVIAKELKYSFEGNLFKTIMKQIEITVKNAGELKDKNVNFQYGLYINNNYEYVDLGDYYIKDIEDDKGKSELVVTGYDKMINFMKTFKQSDLQLTYPCTMLALIQKICEVCGVEIYSTNFFNADLEIDEDYFTAQELTYRDVLDKVAQSTETTIFIKDNKLYLHKLADSPVEKLDASYLTGLTIKEKFGPVNALVLGRGDVEDNVESKDDTSIAKNGRCEIRFDENEFVQYKREQVIDAMFEQIRGLEYYAFEGSDVGIMWLEPCDLIEVEDTEKSIYKTVYLSANITINTGISSDIESDIPEETNTEYKVTTKEEKKTLKVERLAKKNEGLIQDVIEQQTETENKLTKVEQDIDGITETISSVETKVETAENKAENAQNTANDAVSQITTTNEKLTQVEENVDGITQTVSSVETQVGKIEETANNANQKADSAVNQIEVTNENVTKIEQNVNGITDSVTAIETNLNENYSTTEQMNSAIEQKAGSITSSVSESIENIQVGGTNLIPNSAPYNLDSYVVQNNSLIELTLQDEDLAPFDKCLKLRTLQALTGETGIYITPTSKVLEANKEYCLSIWLKATANTNVKVGYARGGQSTFLVTTNWQKFTYKFTALSPTNQTHGFTILLPDSTIEGRQVFVHSIKLEEGNKVTAWSPAPEDDVKGFEFGTKIEQNSKYVQYAWNNESQNIKLEQDNGNSTMGFYDNDTKFAEMGVNNVDNDRYISFGIPVNYGQNIQDGMAWGMQTPDGKFWPILYIKDFHMANKDAGDFSGNLVLSACNLLLEGINSAISCGNVNMCNADVLGGIMFEDATTHKNLLTIMPKTVLDDETINILDKISFYKNSAGTNTLIIGLQTGEHCMMTDDGYFSCREVYSTGDISCSGNIKAYNHIYCNNGVEPFSIVEKKRNIEKYNNSALNEILNTDIYYYNYKEDSEDIKRRVGAIIGTDYNCSKEIIGTEGKGIDLYSMVSVAYKAIQEQQELIQEQNKTIKDLQNRIEKLEQKVGGTDE